MLGGGLRHRRTPSATPSTPSLSKQSGYDPANPHATNNSLATYATNPIWQVVDGPWKLSSFDASGNASFVPNPSYSGSPKPTLAKFVELPFTTDDAEFNALVGGHVNFGYLPLQDVTKPTTNPLVPGAQQPPAGSDFTWRRCTRGRSTTSRELQLDRGRRQRRGDLEAALHPPGLPVPRRPAAVHQQDRQGLRGADLRAGPGDSRPTPSSSRLEKNNPYPYNLSKAKSLLSSHGWKVVPNGTTTCTSPGTGANQCGKDIPAGAKLAFNLEYASGNASQSQLMNTEKSSWAQVGFNITLSQASFDTVIGNATACTPSPSCTWELENWGAGWVYAPDYYPTGEEIFSTGAGVELGELQRRHQRPPHHADQHHHSR